MSGKVTKKHLDTAYASGKDAVEKLIKQSSIEDLTRAVKKYCKGNLLEFWLEKIAVENEPEDGELVSNPDNSSNPESMLIPENTITSSNLQPVVETALECSDDDVSIDQLEFQRDQLQKEREDIEQKIAELTEKKDQIIREIDTLNGEIEKYKIEIFANSPESIKKIRNQVEDSRIKDFFTRELGFFIDKEISIPRAFDIVSVIIYTGDWLDKKRIVIHLPKEECLREFLNNNLSSNSKNLQLITD